MDCNEFKRFRRKLGRTQKEMAQLLGISLKAVHSYEQGWRSIPGHVERQIFFLVSRLQEVRQNRKLCWEVNQCPADRKENCPAWEFQAGDLCWSVSGTLCHGEIQDSWTEKMKLCRSCKVIKSLL